MCSASATPSSSTTSVLASSAGGSSSAGAGSGRRNRERHDRSHRARRPGAGRSSTHRRGPAASRCAAIRSEGASSSASRRAARTWAAEASLAGMASATAAASIGWRNSRGRPSRQDGGGGERVGRLPRRVDVQAGDDGRMTKRDRTSEDGHGSRQAQCTRRSRIDAGHTAPRSPCGTATSPRRLDRDLGRPHSRGTGCHRRVVTARQTSSLAAGTNRRTSCAPPVSVSAVAAAASLRLSEQRGPTAARARLDWFATRPRSPPVLRRCGERRRSTDAVKGHPTNARRRR